MKQVIAPRPTWLKELCHEAPGTNAIRGVPGFHCEGRLVGAQIVHHQHGVGAGIALGQWSRAPAGIRRTRGGHKDLCARDAQAGEIA